MADGSGKVGTGYEAPSPAVQAAIDMPIEQLEAQIAQQESGNVQTSPNPESTQTPSATPTTPVVEGQVAKVEEVKPEGQVVPPIETVQKEDITFEALQKKIGIKSPDALAKSYTEIVKEYQKMKQSEADRQRMEVQTQPPVIPQANPEQNSNFLNQLLENPEMTLAQAYLKMSEVQNAQLREKYADTERKLKFQEMASSPETADFVSDEIQTQMQEEFKARPEWVKSQSEINSHVEEAYWIAKGKVAAKSTLRALEEGRKQGQQSILAKKAGAVESAGSVSAPVVIPSTDPLKMPIADLERLVYTKLQG